MPPERVLASVKSGAVLGKTTRNFTVNLKVPDLIVPNLENCTIIDIGYFFKVWLEYIFLLNYELLLSPYLKLMHSSAKQTLTHLDNTCTYS